jgi:hypothetical protein
MTRAAAALASVMLASAFGAAAARAAYGPAVALASGSYALAGAHATDAAGTTTAIVTGSPGGPRLIERAGGAPWPTGTPLPGPTASVIGPVVAAAGQGTLALAWRVDRPRAYTGIQAAVRDPGGSLSAPIDIAGADAGGVRHPAVAVDAAGDVLLAYNVDTRASHLNLRGAVAVTYRRPHGSFSAPIVVDRNPSSAPVVALAPDGTGLVAWSHDRRIYAVSVGAGGHLGRAKALTPPRGGRGLAVAAARGGDATVAWLDHSPRHYNVRALRRTAGHQFGAAQLVGVSRNYIGALALASDERGRLTLAWGEDHFGDDHSIGLNGITTAIVAADARPGRPFGVRHSVATAARAYRSSVSVVASSGRVALAWSYVASRRDVGVQAAVGSAAAPGPPQTVATSALSGKFALPAPVVHLSLDTHGTATALAVLPVQASADQVTSRLIAVDVTV